MTIDLVIDDDTYLEVQNIASGAFLPLRGFMDSADYRSVVEKMRLDSNAPWTIPVTLEIPRQKASQFLKADKVILKDKKGERVAELMVEDVYKVNYARDIKKVFGTNSKAHPGVVKETARSPYRIGGPISLIKKIKNKFSDYALSPFEIKKKFRELGWKTVVGFQTRNPIHRAHEYLQRVALEFADGLFIHPLIGWRKDDDFSADAIIKSYEKVIEDFYPQTRVILGILTTPMRYAGPREAIFHAIIRRNYGCTHFIVGRDHAGVGNFYGKYEAHELCSKFGDLGIEILKLHGPYYCKKCKCVVTEKTCPHGEKYASHISGTYIRNRFLKGEVPSEKFMRPEISEILLKLREKNKLFCREGES